MIIYACMHAVAWAQSRGIYSDLCCTISNYVQGGQAYMHAQHHARSKIYHACMHFLFSIRIQKMAKRRCHQVGPPTEMLEP